MFLFAFWVISTQKCEAVNFPKFESAGMPIRLFGYLGIPISLRAQAPCIHTCDTHVPIMMPQGLHMMQTTSP